MPAMGPGSTGTTTASPASPGDGMSITLAIAYGKSAPGFFTVAKLARNGGIGILHGIEGHQIYARMSDRYIRKLAYIPHPLNKP